MNIDVETLRELGKVKMENGKVKIFLRPDKLREAARRIHDLGYDTILAISAIDIPHRGIILLRYVLSTRTLAEKRDKVILYLKVPRRAAKAPTVSDIYPFAEYLEREIYEMYGVFFIGNERCKGTFFLDRSLENKFPRRKL